MPLIRKKGLFESNRVLFLPVAEITPNPSQPRVRFSSQGLEELAASIREHGILQPLSVRRVGGGYQLVSGERRLRAAVMAELTTVPCVVVSAGELESSLLALVENLQRRDLDFLEEAQAIRQLIVSFRLSQEEAARRIGKSQSAVANKLRILKLDPDLLKQLQEADLTERHARALLRLPEESRPAALEHIIRKELTVAQSERYIASLLMEPAPPRRQPQILIKDVRLFLNTVERGLDMMRSAGVEASAQRQEEPETIVLTIRIPRSAATRK